MSETSEAILTSRRGWQWVRWPVLFAAAAVAVYAASLHTFSRGPAWPADLQQARVSAVASGQPLLIQFTSASCPYCLRMEREVLSKPEVVRSLAGFELVQVDAWAQPDLSDRYRVEGVPAFVVVGPQGRFIGKIEGYQPMETFNDFLRRAAAGSNPR